MMFSCKRDQEILPIIQHNTQTHFYDTIINPKLIQNYLFNTGTYWIYKDSGTNVIDTCTVDSTKTGYQSYFQRPGNPGGIAYTVLFKYIQNVRKCQFPCKYVLFSNNIFMDKINSACSQIFGLTNVDTSGSINLTVKDLFFANYSIGVNTYSNVYKLFYRNPCPDNYIDIPDSGYYYMKAGIGIIKSEYYINGQKSVYELEDYHIN